MLLEGKSCIITGAGRGIGEATARCFASNGANVVVTDKLDSVKDLALELAGTGRRAIAVQGDLLVDAHIREVVAAAKREFGNVDVLVNNAGVLSQALIGMIDINAMRAMIEVNVVAIVNMTQYAIRLMGKSASPSVINIASIAGTQGMDGVSAYSATKAAVTGFTFAAAKELAHRGIRVNAIAPGFIDTDMTRGLSPEWLEKRLQGIRLGKKIGRPEDVANCALFLASDMSSYVTGQVIGVDGGMIV